MLHQEGYLLSPFLDGPLIPIPAFASCVDVHPVPGDLPASFAPVNDYNVGTNHSASSSVFIDNATIPSPDAVGSVSLTIPPASLDRVKDTFDEQHDPPAVIATVDDAPVPGPGDLPASLAPLDDSTIATNHSGAGSVSVDYSTEHPTVVGLPANLAPLNDSNISIDHSAAGYVSVANVTVPSPDAVGMVILTVPPARLDPVKDTTADRQAPPTVLATVDDTPAKSPGVTDRFIFYGDFDANAPSDIPLPTIFVHPRSHARCSILFWVVVEFKFLALRIMAVLSAFLLTMQDITKEEFARYREKHKILRP